MKPRKVMLCGGGTGGHVLPLVEVARGLKKISPETKIYFVGPEEFPLDALREEGIAVKKIIAAGKIRRYFSARNFAEPFKIPFAFLQSLFIVLAVNPDAVLGKGSYGSLWPILAAWILRKKIIIHESDAIPGLANRFLIRFIQRVAVAFKETKNFFPQKKVYVTGNPVRHKYLGLSLQEAENILGIRKEQPIIFISGGSQGAQKINRVISEDLAELMRRYFVIWSVGAANFNSFNEHRVFDKKNLKIAPFLDERELAAAYTLCDLAVGRAGSGTIFELAAFAKPAILIPLERNGGDQPFNAASYAQTGAAMVLKERELTPENLLKTIGKAIANPRLRAEMSQKARNFAKIDAGEHLAQILLDLGQG